MNRYHLNNNRNIPFAAATCSAIAPSSLFIDASCFPWCNNNHVTIFSWSPIVAWWRIVIPRSSRSEIMAVVFSLSNEAHVIMHFKWPYKAAKCVQVWPLLFFARMGMCPFWSNHLQWNLYTLVQPGRCK